MKRNYFFVQNKQPRSQYEEMLGDRITESMHEKSRRRFPAEKFRKVIFLILVILKSLTALGALGLMPVIFWFCNDLDGSLFGAFLLIVAVILLILSYLLSMICLLMNFFRLRRYGRYWTLMSVISIAAILPSLAIGALCSAAQPVSTILLCLCIGLQAVPSLFELHNLEKNIAEKKKKK